MIIFRQTKLIGFYSIIFFLMFLTVSCGNTEQTAANLSQIAPPTVSSDQSVEYGASLSEWEEATQPNLEFDDLLLEPAPTVTLPAPTPTVSSEEASVDSIFILDGISYQEIMWDALVPADFTADAIMAKYDAQLTQLADGSPEANDLYMQMQAEFNNAPINEAIDGSLIRLPGFIAPLEYTDDLITEFLLVPYFGACIHVPAPPPNQTVLVKLSEGEGIKFEDAYNPIWVMGELAAEAATTDLAEAGYYIENALIELYE